MAQRAVLLTVWCGQCTEQRVRSRGQLGQVVLFDDGRQLWNSGNPDARHPGRRIGAGWTTLHHPRWPTKTPDTLDAVCAHHGVGVVPTAVVRGARGSVVLNLMARE